MEEIKDRFSVKATAAVLEIKELIKEHGDWVEPVLESL